MLLRVVHQVQLLATSALTSALPVAAPTAATGAAGAVPVVVAEPQQQQMAHLCSPRKAPPCLHALLLARQAAAAAVVVVVVIHRAVALSLHARCRRGLCAFMLTSWSRSCLILLSLFRLLNLPFLNLLANFSQRLHSPLANLNRRLLSPRARRLDSVRGPALGRPLKW